MSGRLQRHWPALVALGVFAIALWAQPHALVGVYYDDGLYVVLAKALATGEGFRFIHLPGAPPGVHYPFLYPAALSLLWRVWPSFPANVALFQLFDSAMLATAAWVIGRQSRRLALPTGIAVTAVVLAFLAFPLLAIVGVRFSEPMFLALAAGAVMLADADPPDDRRAAVAGVLAGCAVLTRSIGLALVVGVGVALWLRRRRRSAVVFSGIALATALPWVYWTATRGSLVDPHFGPNYGSYVGAAVHAVAAGGAGVLGLGVAGAYPRLLLPPLPAALWWTAAIGLLAFTVWGAVLVARRAPALVGTLVAYSVVVSVWPYVPDRFVWILVPWLFLCTASAGWWCWRRGGWQRASVAVLAAVVVVGYGRREVPSLLERRFASTAEGISGPFRVLAPAIAVETDSSAVVAGEDEALIYLYAGRRTMPSYLFSLEGRTRRAVPPDSAVRFFCEMGVTDIATAGGRTAAAPLIDSLRSKAPPLLTARFTMTAGPALYRLACPR